MAGSKANALGRVSSAPRPVTRPWRSWAAVAAVSVLAVVGAVLLAVALQSGEDAPGDMGSPADLPSELRALGIGLQPSAATEATIGPEGGTLDLGGDAIVTVPPGVFDVPTILTVERYDTLFEPEQFDVEAAGVYRVKTDHTYLALAAPVTLSLPAIKGRTLFSLRGESGWEVLDLDVVDGRVAVPLTHFSGNWVTKIVAGAEWVSQRIPFGQTGSTRQAAEAIHRTWIETKSEATTKQFAGVGETTKRTHDAICAEFPAMLQDQAGDFTWEIPADYPGIGPLFDFLKHGAEPSTPPAGAEWFWIKVAPAMAAIDGVLARLPAERQLSPAEFLRLATEAAGGNVPLGVLAAHNFLKDTAYRGRQQVDPAFTGEGVESNVQALFGQRASKLETWRRESPWSPVGRYDKLGPLYHIFAAMAGTVFADRSGGGRGAFGTAIVAGEAFLRALGWDNDIPDREKGFADECGYDTGIFILEGLVMYFPKQTEPVSVGRDVPLTLVIRNVPEAGLSVALAVTTGSGELSRPSLSARKGGGSPGCDTVGKESVCGVVVVPKSSELLTVEAASGKLKATVKLDTLPAYVGTADLVSAMGALAAGFTTNRVELTIAPDTGVVSGRLTARYDNFPIGELVLGLGEAIGGAVGDAIAGGASLGTAGSSTSSRSAADQALAKCTAGWILEGPLEGSYDVRTGKLSGTWRLTGGFTGFSCADAATQAAFEKELGAQGSTTSQASWTGTLSGKRITGQFIGKEIGVKPLLFTADSTR